MTVDHKANSADEIKRILKGGGLILNNKVAGELAVTRSVGDLKFKTCVFVYIQSCILGLVPHMPLPHAHRPPLPRLRNPALPASIAARQFESSLLLKVFRGHSD